MFVIGLVIFIIGIVLGYILCVDRISEILNGLGYQNNWFPERFGFLAMIKNISDLLYICITKFLEASFVCVLFFPLVILLTPISDAVFFNNYSILLYCYFPAILGGSLMLLAIVLGERRTPSRRKR